MKKAQLKELIKQSMSEFNDPEYLELMKKADDTGRGYAERDEFRNKAWDLKRAKTGAMTPDEETMVSDYEEEEANKYALDKEEPLEELIKNTDRIVESWTPKKLIKEADLSQANFEDLTQVVKNIAHVNEVGMEEAAMQAIEYIAEQFDIPVDFKDFD
jgi:hypothetical protein